MSARKNHGYQSLTSMALVKAMDLVSGHSRPLDPRPSSYGQWKLSSFNSRRNITSVVSAETSIWPGVEAPADLPHLPPRTHCLTPIPSEDEEVIAIFAQPESPLFKLPPEVLELIYREVLGDCTVHVIRRHDRLSHTLCKHNQLRSQESCRETGCRGFKLNNGTYEHETNLGSSDTLALLQTCRKVYGTAIEILYRTNTFDFDSMESLISFSIGILPERLDAITSLQVDFNFGTSKQFAESTAYNDSPRWERTWRIIGSMRSLQKLSVWISWHRPIFRSVEESRLLDQLDQVKQLEVFEVNLPSLKGKEVKRKYEQWFVIVRRSS